jgi:colanic acid/amylovoran biosynthesis protein
MSEGPLFILAGNGAYPNRGCEAIARGTVSLIRKQYPDARFLCISFFKTREEYESQRESETDPGIRHLSCFHPDRRDALATMYRPATLSYLYRSLVNENRLGRSVYRDMLPELQEAKAVLSIAADNYSLHHGTARLFTALDDVVLENQRPLVLWGASIGPFDRELSYEKFMSAHLRRADRIFAREPATVEYLDSIGVKENVTRAADPAFLLQPTKPKNIRDDFPGGGEAVGLNFSTRLARYVTGGDMDAWTRMVAKTIYEVRIRTELPVVLIPHGTRACSDDYTFMKRALSMVKGVDQIMLMPPRFNAAETKWMIGRMTAFAGVRTHSVIAALSSKVITLTLSYGLKARGINRDVYGDTDLCLDPRDLSPAIIGHHLASMLDQYDGLRDQLSRRVPKVIASAAAAGPALKDLLEH